MDLVEQRTEAGAISCGTLTATVFPWQISRNCSA
jgi:hypothetical protein